MKIKYITGLIYIVDSNDRERLSETRDELFEILNHDKMRGVPVVVIANKQDLPGKCYYQAGAIIKCILLFITIFYLSYL